MLINKNKSVIPPGKMGVPIIGESIQLLIDPDFVEKRTIKYGNIFKSHIFGNPTIFVVGSKGNQFIYENEGKKISSGVALAAPKTTQELIGKDSLVMQMGETHLKNRRILSEVFKTKAISEYIPQIERQINNYIKDWEVLEVFRWHREIKNLTLSIACKLFLSIDLKEEGFSDKYKKYGAGLLSVPLNLPFTTYGNALRSRENLLEIIDNLIKDRLKNKNDFKDALGILIKSGEENDSPERVGFLKEQLLTLLFAGHESLASGLTACCRALSKNSLIKDALIKEQEELGYPVNLTKSDLDKMEILDLFIKEVLRLYPPSNVAPRKILEDLEFEGYLLPKGWNISYSIKQSHLDELIYSEAKMFDLKRYTKIREEDKKEKYCYIPFSGGIRECIGKELALTEMKIFIAILIRYHSWEIFPGQSNKLVLFPTSYPKSQLKVRFYRKNI